MKFVRTGVYYTETHFGGSRANMDEKFTQAVDRIVREDSRYHPDAYEFINEAVSYTVKKLARTGKPRGARHISGGELVAGTMDLAVEQFGPLAPDVLENWGVHSEMDVGNIVYNMIGVELLSASPEDSRSDFNCNPNLIGELRVRLTSPDVPSPSDPPIIA